MDVNHFDPNRPSRLSRKVFGIPPQHTIVGFMARLTRQKDPLTFLRAAALALAEEPQLHFFVVGDGKLPPGLPYRNCAAGH
ncbi:MAG: hypothetical protein U5L96_06335 [Owenweeksia sp.]|nr:hypothetical protein [Owenweeksia sp.]